MEGAILVISILLYVLASMYLLAWLYKHRNRYTRPLCSYCGAKLRRVDLRRPDFQPEVVYRRERSKLVCSHCNQKTVVEVVYDGPWLYTWPESSPDSLEPSAEYVRLTGYKPHE